jgi:hypothetical protein
MAAQRPVPVLGVLAFESICVTKGMDIVVHDVGSEIDDRLAQQYASAKSHPASPAYVDPVTFACHAHELVHPQSRVPPD